jgi:hypothetical protein
MKYDAYAPSSTTGCSACIESIAFFTCLLHTRHKHNHTILSSTVTSTAGLYHIMTNKHERQLLESPPKAWHTLIHILLRTTRACYICILKRTEGVSFNWGKLGVALQWHYCTLLLPTCCSPCPLVSPIQFPTRAPSLHALPCPALPRWGWSLPSAKN